jgi:hypothetical protein
LSKDKKCLLNQDANWKKARTDTEAEQKNAAVSVQEADSAWYEKFKAWQEYRQAKGKDPTQRSVLGKWLMHQRERPEHLSEDKRCLLHKEANQEQDPTEKTISSGVRRRLRYKQPSS